MLNIESNVKNFINQTHSVFLQHIGKHNPIYKTHCIKENACLQSLGSLNAVL